MEPSRILLLDRDPDVFRQLDKLLGEGEAVVIRVEKSSEALRVLQNERIVLAVLDAESCTMPIEDIVPLIRGIDRDLPIIVTCECNTPDLERQVRTQKIFYYHIKGFGISELELAVKNALQKCTASRRAVKEGTS
jgi:DNA-binding NtrC family response regulator